MKENQKGQAMVEYMIILSITLGLVTYFIRKGTGSFDQTTAKYGGRVEQQLRTGSAPATIWQR